MLLRLALVSALMAKVAPWLHTHLTASTVGRPGRGLGQGAHKCPGSSCHGFLNKGSTCSLLEASDPGVCAQL